MTGPAAPDPIVVVLGEIRDVLAEIRDAVKPKQVRMADMATPISSEPRLRDPGPKGHIIG